MNLQKDDEIVLYSDGIPDTQNSKDEFFGIENFMKAIEDSAEKNADEQTAEIARKIEMFRGSKAQTDDLTFIILKNAKKT